MRNRRRARGYSIVTVVVVLALLMLMMDAALRLLVSHVEQTRKRGERQYGLQLSQSGLDWGKACLASGNTSCATLLNVAGGEIDVSIQRKGELFLIHSVAKVVRRGVASHTRETFADYAPPPPPPEPAPPPPPLPPETPPAPGEPEVLFPY